MGDAMESGMSLKAKKLNKSARAKNIGEARIAGVSATISTMSEEVSLKPRIVRPRATSPQKNPIQITILMEVWSSWMLAPFFSKIEEKE